MSSQPNELINVSSDILGGKDKRVFEKREGEGGWQGGGGWMRIVAILPCSIPATAESGSNLPDHAAFGARCHARSAHFIVCTTATSDDLVAAFADVKASDWSKADAPLARARSVSPRATKGRDKADGIRRPGTGAALQQCAVCSTFAGEATSSGGCFWRWKKARDDFSRGLWSRQQHPRSRRRTQVLYASSLIRIIRP